MPRFPWRSLLVAVALVAAVLSAAVAWLLWPNGGSPCLPPEQARVRQYILGHADDPQSVEIARMDTLTGEQYREKVAQARGGKTPFPAAAALVAGVGAAAGGADKVRFIVFADYRANNRQGARQFHSATFVFVDGKDDPALVLGD